MRILLIFLMLLSAGQAEVIIYKGTAAARLPHAVSQFSATPHFYLVYDNTAHKGYPIFYYTLAGVKRQAPQFPMNNTRYVSETISATRIIGTITAVADNTISATDFGVNMFYFRGDERKLEISNSGTAVYGHFPKTLIGLYRVSQSSPSANFEFDFVLAYDKTQTELANNAVKNGFDTATYISGVLTQRGFQ